MHGQVGERYAGTKSPLKEGAGIQAKQKRGNRPSRGERKRGNSTAGEAVVSTMH